jgi:hypothetical protein
VPRDFLILNVAVSFEGVDNPLLIRKRMGLTQLCHRIDI